MLSNIASPKSLLWLLACAAGGALLGALLVRASAPASTPEPLADVPAGLKALMGAGALAGALCLLVGGALLLRLDGWLGAPTRDGVLWQIARAVESIAAGALLGGLLSLAVVAGDYREVLVAMWDFHGVLLAWGGLAGGALGAIRGVAVSRKEPLWLALLSGAGLSLCGGAAGIALGLALAWLLASYVLRFSSR